MPFPRDVVFACLAADQAYIHPADVVQVNAEIQVSGTSPVELDATWQKWLGSIQSDEFRRSGLFITASRALRRGEAPRTDELEQRVRLLHLCLLLRGCAFTPGGLMVGGNTQGGHLHVGPLQRFEAYPRPSYRRFTRLTPAHVHAAGALLPGAEEIYTHNETRYRRLRLGCNSLLFALRNHYVDHRLHWCVRSIEAILRLPRQGITGAFKARGQELIGNSRRNERLLEQIYNLRSCVEHVKSFQSILRKPRGIREEHAFAFWSLSAELLASATYERVFATAALRECFQNERRTAAFWHRNPLNRAHLIGHIADLWPLTKRQFHRMDFENWL